ncbi:hypothetical protein H2136_20810 [Aeromonas hydrophila]|uniref:Uncharacterized protein n=1 Tax=Aeromonas hydrophila TaxID=644 RepID=A0A926FPA3_AERHY|nr:hypothetical protein [Aeromonas hydrophila]
MERDQIRWACCWTMAKSPGVAVRRDHHLVGEPVRRSGLRRGDRGQERAAVLQPPAVQCRPATLPSRGHRWGAAGPWPSPRLDGRQGPSPGGQPGPAAWLPGAGDRRQERAAVLQPLEAPRWPAAPASPRWCEIRSGGRVAGPWPSPRAWRCAGIITWWANRSGGLALRGV